MYPLFETIAIEKGKIQNLSWHQRRYERSLVQFYGKRAVDFEKISRSAENMFAHIQVPAELAHSLVRCRIDYNATDFQIQYFPYQRKIYRHFQPVICDHIDYSLKFTDRHLLNELVSQKGDRDEIMIIKQGKITDCSIGNLIFKKNNEWFTPDSPLLQGTMRERLIAEKKITAIPIFLTDVDQFDEICLINAMNDLPEKI